MSYDLTVHARDRMDLAALLELARAVPGLDVAPRGPDLVATRAGEYAFDAGEPEPIDAEDVPPEVAELLAATCWLYSVTVQGSGEDGIRDAIRFADALADAADGAVYDQRDGIRIGGVVHRPDVPPDERVDVRDLRWYFHERDRPADLGERWLELCRRHLPAALPLRFGETEPPRGRLETSGDAGFVAALHDADTMLIAAGRPPCYSMTFSAARQPTWSGPVHSHSLVVDLATDVLDLFVDGAAALGCCYAEAAVQRGMAWTGRSLYSDGAGRAPYLAGLGRFIGLPPEPTAWTWFGPAYAAVVRRHLPTAEPRAGGLLYRRPDPAPDPWLPARLLARRERPDGPLVAAARIPRTLRPSPWSALFGRG